MTFRKFFSVAFVSATVLSACTNDTETSSVESEYVNSVRVTVEGFKEDAPATRTSHILTSTGMDIQWAEGDALGIYPVGGDQHKFPISSGVASASASFDGGAWKLRSNYQYAAYYPFSVDNYMNPQTAIPVDYTGQTQDGNNPTAHLGKYDFLACGPSTPDANGNVDLALQHLGAFLRMQLTMPKADSYSKVELKLAPDSDGGKDRYFVTKGTYDLTKTPTIRPTEESATYTINLINVSTAAENETITIYAMVAPSVVNAPLTIKVYGADGMQTYVAKDIDSGVQGFAKGRAYTITATLVQGEHEYVDLGLPSGTLWATCNLGANSPEEYGGYFAWGETKTKETYGYSTYKWCNGTYDTLTKYNNYNSNYGTLDRKTELDPEDDAATANWGSDWRMPSLDQIEELCNSDNTTTEWTTLNGVNGRLITSKANGKSLFLPAAGVRGSSSLALADSHGFYWSRSLSEDPTGAFILHFKSDNIYSDYYWRENGQSVRPVRK